jgi:hypothetical protein
MRKLIIILFVIIGQVSFGQVYQIMPQYGYSAPRFNTDSTLQLPTFNGVPTLKSNKTNKGAIAIDSTNGRFYFYNPKTSAWSQVTGGSSVDTISLSNRINLKIDSLKRFNDTVYSYKNGSRTFAFKDSVGTNPAPVGYYGSFYDTTIQTAAAINTPYAMKLSNTDLSNGISISNNSRINIAHTGVYNIQFSAQFDRTNSGTDVIDIWLRKNGINVIGSDGKIVLSGTAVASQMIASWNYVLSAIDNDYFEIMWSSPDTHVRLLSEVTQTSPFAHPNIPSVILTVTQQSGIMAGTGIQAADTTAMLIPYMKKNDSTIYYSKYRSDTSRTNIYSGINSKLNSSDSSVYYTKYRSDTSRTNIYSGINGKLNKGDSTIYYSKYSSDTSRTNIYSGISTKLAKSDTSTLSTRIDLKLNISDTSNMLSKYLRKTDTATLSNRINLKLNIADTSTMLNPYLRKSDTSTLSTRINTKLAITDTSTLQSKSLASYTFQANNTTATANATAQIFKDTTGTYTGTPTWSGGTAPTTLTNAVFSYTQVGKMVTLRITMIYTNQGSTNTRIAIPLMATMPTPVAPSGYTSTSDIFGFGAGYFGNVSTSIVAGTTGSSVCYIKGTATGYEVVVDRGASGSGKYVWATISYFTN